MKDIEDKLKEKYDEVEVPSYMFDTSRVFKRVEEEKKQRNRKIISIVASVMVILIVVVLLFFVIPKGNNEEYDIKEKTNINEVKGNVTIKIDNPSYSSVGNIYIAAININKIIAYDIINNIPYSKVEANIIECYSGSENEVIELYIPGGIFAIKDIKEKIAYEYIDDISKYNEEDFVKVSYSNEIYIPIPEEGKTYITTFYEEDGKYFVDMNRPYGFKEYDPETNIVKDDMGDVELEIDKYLENINI